MNKQALAIAFLVFLAGTALAQPAGYEYPAQKEALDGVLGLRPGADDEIPELFEISRMLSAPCDRAMWLAEKIRPLTGNERTRDGANALLGAGGPFAQWSAELKPTFGDCNGSLGELEQKLKELAAWTPPPPPVTGDGGVTPPKAIWELRDPAELAREWTATLQSPSAIGNLRDVLPPDGALSLTARGIPRTELGRDYDRGYSRAPYLQPIDVVDQLTQRPKGLAEPSELLKNWDSLGKAYKKLDGKRGDLSGEFQTLADDMFEIAFALLDRALGVDAQDRGGQPTSAAQWGEMARRFENQDFWVWSTLARILEGANSPDPAAAAAAAEQQWNQLKTIVTGIPARSSFFGDVGDRPNGWVARLKLGGGALQSRVRGMQEDRIPLDPDYRGRQSRPRYEQEFLTAWQSDNLDAALQAIQRAKAVSNSLDPAALDPVNMAGLDRTLSLTNGVPGLYLFVELFEVQSRSEYYAIVFRASEYSGLQGDKYLQEKYGPDPSRSNLMRQVLAKDTGHREDRILIAFDGPIQANDDWFALERTAIVPRVQLTDGWICYTPSAATLTNSKSWTTSRVFGAWLAFALRGGIESIDCYGKGARDEVGAVSLPRNWKEPDYRIYAISCGDRFPNLGSVNHGSVYQKIKELKGAGRESVPIMLVFSSQ